LSPTTWNTSSNSPTARWCCGKAARSANSGPSGRTSRNWFRSSSARRPDGNSPPACRGAMRRSLSVSDQIKREENVRLRTLLAGAVLAFAFAAPASAADAVKIGFITKFPVPFFATMEDAAKEYAAANPGVEIIYGQGASATDIEGQIGLIESMVTQGVQGIALTPVDPTVATALDKAVG